MKKLFLFLLPLFSLLADEPDLSKSESLWDFHPLHVGGNAIALGKADVDIKNGPHSGDILFNKVNAFTSFILPINRTNFFFPRIEWNAFTMDWNKNPKFKETHFQYMQFALTYMCIAIEKWRWISRVDYNVDVKHFSQWGKYGLFSALIWGTHDIAEDWHFHVGGFGYTGFEGDTVYPVIGVDYTYNKKWFFQLVFPITYSIEYILDKEWRLSLKGRPLKERFRVGAFEPQPDSIFNYSSMGLEFNAKYEKFLRLEVEMFAGYNFGGGLYIKNRRGHNALYTNVQGAPYAGLSVNWGI